MRKIIILENENHDKTYCTLKAFKKVILGLIKAEVIFDYDNTPKHILDSFSDNDEIGSNLDEFYILNYQTKFGHQIILKISRVTLNT